MRKNLLYGAGVIGILGILSLISVTNYSYSATSSASTQESADALHKSTAYVDTLCTSPKFVLLSPIHDKISQLLADKKYPTYKSLLTDISTYIEQTLPGCYDPSYKSSGVAELSVVRTQGIEANDGQQGLPHSSGYFRRFYHVYYSWRGVQPKNPVLLYRIPEEAGCLMGIWWGNIYNDMYYSTDTGKTWQRWKTENTGCIQATHVKIVPSPESILATFNSDSYMLSLHLGTKTAPNKDLCIDLIYTADNAQYLETQICEKMNASLTQTDSAGTLQTFGYDLGSIE